MSSIASLGRMVSGLEAAQKGLAVTGHNISNLNTEGYIRQQLLQHESRYLNIGSGQKVMQVGLGTSLTEIRQIRNELADRRYRTEISIRTYYQTASSVVSEIESILDEPYGEAISKMLSNFWSQAQKLAVNPSGVEERLSFLQSANVLMKKQNYIMESLQEYQENLNTEVIKTVNRINELAKSIRDYNQEIAFAEASGENANDLRDRRNLLLDELSQYIDITYEEEPNGEVRVKAEGRILVDNVFVTEMDLVQTTSGSSFVKPVWKGSNEDVFPFNLEVNSSRETDKGKLKALLMARGNDVLRQDVLDASGAVVKEGTTWEDIALNDNISVDATGNSFLIPKIMKKFEELINGIVTTVNESFSGEGIGIHKDKLGVPVFVPIKVPPTAPSKPTEPDPNDPIYAGNEALYISDYNTYIDSYKDYLKTINTYLTPGNIQVNPELLKDGGYNKLGTVPRGTDDIGDNTLVNNFLTKWNEPIKWPLDASSSNAAPKSKIVDFMAYYNELVTEIGAEGSLYSGKATEKNIVVQNINNERLSMGAVSQDEELTYMMRYQYAYNASARMITVLDGMMDVIINQM